MSRRDRGRLGAAIALSTLLHAGVAVVAWVAVSRAEPLPQMRVYAVDIVSPPPQQQGEWSPEPATPPEPVAEPEPEQPEPEPPLPEPEPLPAPPTKKKPEPEKPKPKPEQPKPQPAQQAKAEAPKPRPSTGQNPDPTSPGGEALNYQLKGVQCPTPEYCNNIIRQVNRYFRSPAGAAGAEADVFFVINRDGTVDDIRLISATGGAAFRLAVMEAVEQAGLNQAFGPLPKAFPGDQLPVSFYFRPAR